MPEERQAYDTDKISRFIYSSRQYKNSGKIDHSVFMDTRDPSELSVFVTTDLQEGTIWPLATIVRSDRAVRARADLKVRDVHNLHVPNRGFLQVLIDGIPHPRHANIKNLPTEDAIRRAVAADLANQAQLVTV